MATEKLLVGTISEIDARGSRKIRFKESEIAIFRLSDGNLLAVENKCPHKGGQLSEGMVCGTAVHCPLHDWKIDLRSGRVQEPDEGCVPTYPVELDQKSGFVYIRI